VLEDDACSGHKNTDLIRSVVRRLGPHDALDFANTLVSPHAPPIST
jgi:hypothetical protein